MKNISLVAALAAAVVLAVYFGCMALGRVHPVALICAAGIAGLTFKVVGSGLTWIAASAVCGAAVTACAAALVASAFFDLFTAGHYPSVIVVGTVIYVVAFLLLISWDVGEVS